MIELYKRIQRYIIMTQHVFRILTLWSYQVISLGPEATCKYRIIVAMTYVSLTLLTEDSSYME